MLTTRISPIRIRSKTPEAEYFWKIKYKPLLDQIKADISNLELSILLWAPNIDDTVRVQLHEIESELATLNVSMSVLTPRINPPDIPAAFAELENKSRETDIIVALLLGEAFPLRRLLMLSAQLISRLYLFLDNRIIKSHEKKSPDFRVSDMFERLTIVNYPDDLRGQKFKEQILYFVSAIRTIRSINGMSDKTRRKLKSSVNVFSLFVKYKEQMDVFLTSGYLFLLSFIRYLASITRELCCEQLHVSLKDLETALRYLEDIGLIKEKEREAAQNIFVLTSSGHVFFELFNLTSLPILEKEKQNFKEKWIPALERTFFTNFELFEHTKKLDKLSEALYFSIARKHPISRWIYTFLQTNISLTACQQRKKPSGNILPPENCLKSGEKTYLVRNPTGGQTNGNEPNLSNICLTS